MHGPHSLVGIALLVSAPLLQTVGSASAAPRVDGDYAVTSRVYDVASGVAPLWAEDQAVTVSGGVYSAILGAGTTTSRAFGTALFAGDDRWLAVVTNTVTAGTIQDGAVERDKLAGAQCSLRGLMSGGSAEARGGA